MINKFQPGGRAPRCFKRLATVRGGVTACATAAVRCVAAPAAPVQRGEVAARVVTNDSDGLYRREQVRASNGGVRVIGTATLSVVAAASAVTDDGRGSPEPIRQCHTSSAPPDSARAQRVVAGSERSSDGPTMIAWHCRDPSAGRCLARPEPPTPPRSRRNPGIRVGGTAATGLHIRYPRCHQTAQSPEPTGNGQWVSSVPSLSSAPRRRWTCSRVRRPPRGVRPSRTGSTCSRLGPQGLAVGRSGVKWRAVEHREVSVGCLVGAKPGGGGADVPRHPHAQAR